MKQWLFLLATALMFVAPAMADESPQSKSVIGPRNPALHDGALELRAGNAEAGVQLTLRGLASAVGEAERVGAHANLCAGFVMLGQPNTALQHCDWVLDRHPDHWRTYNNRAIVYMQLDRFEEAEADIEKGQQLRPQAETLKEVKGMYLDAVEPVVENITIDDRRNEPKNPVRKPE